MHRPHWRGTLLGEPKQERQTKGSQTTAGRLAELNSTRSNTTAPTPKVHRRVLENQHQVVSWDAHLSVRRAPARRCTDGRRVGGRSKPEIGEWGATVKGSTSLPRIRPFQVHNNPIRELDGRWNRSAVDPAALEPSSKRSPQGNQRSQIIPPCSGQPWPCAQNLRHERRLCYRQERLPDSLVNGARRASMMSDLLL